MGPEPRVKSLLVLLVGCFGVLVGNHCHELGMLHQLNQMVSGTAVKLSGKLCGLLGHWKKKIARKMKAVKGRIDTVKHQIGHLKEVVSDQASKPGSGNWWSNQKGNCRSQMVSD